MASANAILYCGATPVFADIDPVTLNLDPAAAEAHVTPRTKAILPVHIFGYPADMPAFERGSHSSTAWRSWRTRVRRWGPNTPTARQSAPRQPRGVRLLRQQADDHGGGGMVTFGDGALKERIDSERNQGRAPDMGWLDHDRLGFNYRLSELACALGIAQLGRLDEMLAARASVAALYREALAGIDGLGLPCPDQGGNVRGWFVFVVQLPPGADRAAVIRELGEAGIQSKPYLPAIHLMSFYAERFGFGPGEHPRCEAIAESSLALPFFPGMTEGEVGRVAEWLRAAACR